MATSRAVVRVEMDKASIKANAQAVVKQRLFRSGNIIRTQVLKKLQQGPKTGRVYYVPGTRVKYTASAPGETPARRTGDLARSYRLEPPRLPEIGGYILIGSELPYAFYLEYGTKTETGQVRMAPRPHLVPAWQEVRPAVMKFLRTGT